MRSRRPVHTGVPVRAGSNRSSLFVLQDNTSFNTPPHDTYQEMSSPPRATERVVVAIRLLKELQVPASGIVPSGIVSMSSQNNVVYVDGDAHGFAVDHALWSSSQGDTDSDGGPPIDQAGVYARVFVDQLSHVFNGVNLGVIAYGQTGSGKTYTMMGTTDNSGRLVGGATVSDLACLTPSEDPCVGAFIFFWFRVPPAVVRHRRCRPCHCSCSDSGIRTVHCDAWNTESVFAIRCWLCCCRGSTVEMTIMDAMAPVLRTHSDCRCCRAKSRTKRNVQLGGCLDDGAGGAHDEPDPRHRRHDQARPEAP
jgi:hypothetical protein